VTVLSAHELIFEGQANRVILPGEAGVFEVCPFHRPLMSRLLPGLIVVDEQAIPIQRGVVRVDRESVTVITEPQSSDEASASTSSPIAS